MSQHGLLIDYEFCTGCHACEVACKLDGDTWEWDYLPMPTQRCDLCQDRIDAGKVPACVHHCQSLAMEFGPIEELAKKVAKPRMVLYSVQ